MAPDHEGFLYPAIDFDICTECGECERICPVLQYLDSRRPLSVFAAINKDEIIRSQSSSGGVFTLLAQFVLDHGGVVFGAGWSNDLLVVHKKVESRDELSELRGSKYVQSDLKDTYKSVKKYLEANRFVLFSGTPCQVAGLHALVGKEIPENLFCLDFICHGTPSPKIFHKYVRELEDTQGLRIQEVFFRNKRLGWKNYSLYCRYSDHRFYMMNVKKDIYLQGFLKNLYNRPSCHRCAFRDLRSGADITLADYWRVHETFPEMDDDRGTSLVLINNHKGHSLWSHQKKYLKTEEATYEDARRTNSILYRSPPPHKMRSYFFSQYENQPLRKLIKKCLREPMKQRVLRIFIHCISKSLRFINAK